MPFLGSGLPLTPRRSLLCPKRPHPSGLSSLILHEPLMGTHLSQHPLDSGSQQDSAECTVFWKSLHVNQVTKYPPGPHGCYGPTRWHPGHVASKKPLSVMSRAVSLSRKSDLCHAGSPAHCPYKLRQVALPFQVSISSQAQWGERHLPHPPLRLAHTKHHTNMHYY